MCSIEKVGMGTGMKLYDIVQIMISEVADTQYHILYFNPTLKPPGMQPHSGVYNIQ